MANPIYIWYKGVTQGPIEGFGSWAGEDDQKGKEGSSLVLSLTHEVTSPRDSATGLASGRRIHQPLTITKRIDKASPKLYMALTKNEQLSEVTVKWFRVVQAGGGGQEHYFTTQLFGAVVTIAVGIGALLFVQHQRDTAAALFEFLGAGLALLVDQPGMNRGRVLSRHHVIPARHAERNALAPQHNVIEGLVHFRLHPSEVGSGRAVLVRMAQRAANRIEQRLPLRQGRRCHPRGLRGRLGRDLGLGQLGRDRYGSAIELED